MMKPGSRRFWFLANLSTCSILWHSSLVCALLSGGSAFGQVNPRAATKFYSDSSDTADALLRNAASHVRDRQWAEAVDIYQRVIQQFGEKVAKLPKDDAAGETATTANDSVLYVDLRQFCQRQLAALPAEARELYRSRVDVQAERWYRQGLANRDRAMLRRVVELAFCSSWGDDAIELLGDLAFQDGRFEEALAAYRHLVPDKSGARANLVHPDPSVDLARVAAKKLICRAALGENPPTAADLDAFAASFPEAQGSLAGRDGPYLATLKTLLDSDRIGPPKQSDVRWPTFAGAPTRTRIAPGPVDVGSVQWQIDIQPVTLGVRPRYGRGIGMVPSNYRPDRLLAYHPIIVGDQVIVCDEDEIYAYNLNDRPDSSVGVSSALVKYVWKHPEDQGTSAPAAARPTAGPPRFTLTAFGDRVYARMGLTTPPYMGGRSNGGPQNYLVAVDRATEGKLLWKKPSTDVAVSEKPAEAASRNLGFEGTPVADARSVYVAMTDRREQISTYVVCLDADTGATRWVRYLGAAASDNDNMFGMGMGMGGISNPSGNDFGHRLLSLDGPTIYYQTNLGAVVALDAESGSVRWVATYPRVDRNQGASHDRDLNPAIVYDGLVIVAPDDANAIHAFDAVSGRLVWKSDPIADEDRLAHLLGVAQGKLVATGDRVLFFSIKTGKLVHSWPDARQGFEGYGRGVLAGDKIYWPTRNEIHVLDQATGLRSEPPIKLQETYQQTGGNLAVGDGYLVVAQADKLVVFCQNRRLIQRYREEIARHPDQAGPYFRLARAAEAIGDDSLALESLSTTLERARPSENVDGVPLLEAAGDQRFRLLLRIGDRALADKNFAGAEKRFHEAFQGARLDRDRLRARLAESDAQLASGAASKAVATLHELLMEDRFRNIAVASEEGRRSTRSDILIADRLATIIHDRGRSVYADYDRKARALYESGKAAGEARTLEEVARSFPLSESVPQALLALARVHENAKRPAQAARAYKRLLATAPTDALRARALLGLARAFEEQKLWAPARDAYAQALTRFSSVNVALEDLGTETPLGPLVAQRLIQPPFDRMTGDRVEPPMPVPLTRRWSRTLIGPARPIPAEGVPPSSESSRLFLAKGSEIGPVNAADGASPWAFELGSAPIWVGYLDDRIVVGTENGLSALGLKKGNVLWKSDLADAAAKRASGPFATPTGGKAANEPVGKLHGFRIVGSQVYCLRGDRELIAFDGDTGLIDWSFRPIAGKLNPNVFVGPQRVILQVLEPRAVLVLDTSNGRRLAEHAQTEADDAWPRPPLPIDDDRVALVLDRRTVGLYDFTKGVNTWIYRESRELPVHGPPRLFGDAERLMLLHDGTELVRLDAATGLKKWSRPLGSENLSERADALTLDGERIYCVNGQVVSGIRLGDGSTAWSRHLVGPRSGWAVELTERCVLAYPGQREEGEEVGDGVPLVLRRRDTGDLVQRVLFAAPSNDVTVRLSPGGALVATPTGLWSLASRTDRPMDGASRDR